jgi:hypothetical protein
MGKYTTLSWLPSTDDVIGYHVYRARNPAGPYVRITSMPVTETQLADNGGSIGDSYMVRAVKLETSASGTYYNASQGAFSYGDMLKVASKTMKLQTPPEIRLRPVVEPSTGEPIAPTGESTNGVAPITSAVNSSGGGQ